MLLQVKQLTVDDWRSYRGVEERTEPPVSVSVMPDSDPAADDHNRKVEWSRVHEEQRRARQRIVLWRYPFLTLRFFIKELQIEVAKAFRRFVVLT